MLSDSLPVHRQHWLAAPQATLKNQFHHFSFLGIYGATWPEKDKPETLSRSLVNSIKNPAADPSDLKYPQGGTSEAENSISG